MLSRVRLETCGWCLCRVVPKFATRCPEVRLVRSNKWELEEALRALRAGEYALCGRYLENALERVRCMYCHGDLDDGKPYHSHFKGYVHDECADKYSGRMDYERQHGEIS